MDYFIIFNPMTDESINININDFSKYSTLLTDEDEKGTNGPVKIINDDIITVVLNYNINFSCLELLLEYINMHKNCIHEEKIPPDKPLKSKEGKKPKIKGIYKNQLDVDFFTKVSTDHNNIVQLLPLSKMLKMDTLLNKTVALFALFLKKNFILKDLKNNEAKRLIDTLNEYFSPTQFDKSTEFENQN